MIFFHYTFAALTFICHIICFIVTLAFTSLRQVNIVATTAGSSQTFPVTVPSFIGSTSFPVTHPTILLGNQSF